MLINNTPYRTVWMEGKTVRMLNQVLLPDKVEIVDCSSFRETADRIKDMTIRGAGAIGAAGAYAMAQAFCQVKGTLEINVAKEYILSRRPTAQNLRSGVEFVLHGLQTIPSSDVAKRAIALANEYADADANACKTIGEYGNSLFKDGMRILTHCNAGWLAFVDWGSALSPIYIAKRSGKKVFVFVDETRPRGQGSKLTSFELTNEGIECAVIADNAAGYYMQRGEVDLVIVGSDRIAANGDVANKIGTYEKAVLAKENNIPFYVAAPTTTFDHACATGDSIPIEERNGDEVLFTEGYDEAGNLVRVRIASKHVKAKNPAFDVTPACYITGIITEKGIAKANAKDIMRLRN